MDQFHLTVLLQDKTKNGFTISSNNQYLSVQKYINALEIIAFKCFWLKRKEY